MALEKTEMARKMDVDWSDWDGKAKAPPEHPLSKPLSGKLIKGADVAREALATGNIPETFGKPAPQPTNEQLFGGGVVSEEMIKKAEDEWNNKIQDTLTEARKPVDHLNKPKIDVKWGYGKSFNQLLKGQLSDEEIAQRNMSVKE